MSNIEPTEEQKQAARAWQDGVERRESGHPTLALFLAEREAKLRKQLAFMEAGSLADYNAFAEALQKEDAYLAEINLINERLAEMRGRMLYDRDVIIDTLRARVAELEADLAAFMFGEAQHLADIKALREALGQGYALSLNAREQVLKATAHYDDAKADAPTVRGAPFDEDLTRTEGGEG